MRVLVCVKAIPAGAQSWTRAGSAGPGPSVLNELDRHAIEAAVQLKQARSDVEVVTLMMAPASASPAARETLGVGADRAIVLADAGLEGSDLLATSRALARAIESEGADLVLFGPQSADGVGALMWAAVAERLLLPAVAHAIGFELDADGGVLVRHQTERGYERLRAPLPCIVGVAAPLNQPRLASAKSKIAARSKPLQLL
ncbi:MAG: hypothetical protein JST59_04310, partial [Actinobacteria bacterium]|nr:hypothetical protein [Actinomycetota bacterium]